MLYDDLLQINLMFKYVLNVELIIFILVKLCEKKIIYNKRLIDNTYVCVTNHTLQPLTTTPGHIRTETEN